MKKLLTIVFALLLLIGTACSGNQQNRDATTEKAYEQHNHNADASAGEKEDKKPLSPRTNAMADIGSAHIHIDYSSPGVRGRTIWGGLVAYDQVWVTGAHKATSITFSKDVKIKGQLVSAGTYGFFTIPGQEKWVLILNKNHAQHLADDYDEALDVLRMSATPEQLTEPAESLTYEVQPTGGNKGVISVMWEQIKVSFEVEIP